MWDHDKKLTRKILDQRNLTEIVDSEISFNFKRTKQSIISSENTKVLPNPVPDHFEWLKTMVVIYQDLFSFDIKTEKKDDYEGSVKIPEKKKRRKRRYGRY